MDQAHVARIHPEPSVLNENRLRVERLEHHDASRLQLAPAQRDHRAELGGSQMLDYLGGKDASDRSVGLTREVFDRVAMLDFESLFPAFERHIEIEIEALGI